MPSSTPESMVDEAFICSLSFQTSVSYRRPHLPRQSSLCLFPRLSTLLSFPLLFLLFSLYDGQMRAAAVSKWTKGKAIGRMRGIITQLNQFCEPQRSLFDFEHCLGGSGSGKRKGTRNKVAACQCLCIGYFRVRTSGSTDKHKKREGGAEKQQRKTTLSTEKGERQSR